MAILEAPPQTGRTILTVDQYDYTSNPPANRMVDRVRSEIAAGRVDLALEFALQFIRKKHPGLEVREVEYFQFNNAAARFEFHVQLGNNLGETPERMPLFPVAAEQSDPPGVFEARLFVTVEQFCDDCRAHPLVGFARRLVRTVEEYMVKGKHAAAQEYAVEMIRRVRPELDVREVRAYCRNEPEGECVWTIVLRNGLYAGKSIPLFRPAIDPHEEAKLASEHMNRVFNRLAEPHEEAALSAEQIQAKTAAMKFQHEWQQAPQARADETKIAGRTVFQHFCERHFPYLCSWNEPQLRIAEALQHGFNGFPESLTVPRGCGATTLIGAGALYAALNGLTRHVAVVSPSLSLARANFVWLQDKLRSETFRKGYPRCDEFDAADLGARFSVQLLRGGRLSFVGPQNNGDFKPTLALIDNVDALFLCQGAPTIVGIYNEDDFGVVRVGGAREATPTLNDAGFAAVPVSAAEAAANRKSFVDKIKTTTVGGGEVEVVAQVDLHPGQLITEDGVPCEVVPLDKCGDCRGSGKYQPLVGPPENCRACNGRGEI